MSSLLQNPGLNWRKQEKTLPINKSRQFRYDQNQIPYDYTVEVIDRFKGLDLIDRVPEEYLYNVYK